MRAATSSEKFLLGILALVLLGGAVFFGGRALSQRMHALENERSSLRADNADAQVDLMQESMWSQRAKWIHDHEPAFGEEGDTHAAVSNFVVQGARSHHLDVQNQELGGIQRGPGGVRVEARVTVKGSMEGLCRWLAEMQQPANFYAVEIASLKADQDMKSMVCELHISRYFQEGKK